MVRLSPAMQQPKCTDFCSDLDTDCLNKNKYSYIISVLLLNRTLRSHLILA